MNTINDEILKQAKKETSNLKRKVTIGLKKEEFPIDKLFVCPFCNYTSKNGNGTAKIFSSGNNFFCFACREWRYLE